MSTKNKNQVGRNSLIISIMGLIATQALISLGYLEHKNWLILLAGFEAATIGGFADWFAVRALFHEIPIPFVKKHTNIIVNNRKNLTEGVVDLVTNKWLSPEVIKEKIANVSIIGNVIRTLREPQNTDRIVGFLREITGRLASSLDSPEVARILQAILKDQIRDIDIATPLGNWLKKSIESGDHNQLWHMILDSAQKTINDSDTHDTLTNMVQHQMSKYKKEGFFKKFFIGAAELVGGVDSSSIADKIIDTINDFIMEAKESPDHPVRKKFDQSMLDFAGKLINGDAESKKIISNLQDRLVENADASDIIQRMLTNFKKSISTQLKENDSHFNDFLKQNVNTLLHELESDQASQEKIDVWIKDTIEQLIAKYHDQIGEMVRTSLTKLNDLELVGQIEEKVGADLQYIRLNGAVVGGCVGIFIAVIRLLTL